MKVLLDTHAFLWFIAGDPKLSRDAQALMKRVDTVLYLSAASLWEIAIKASLGKLTLLAPYGQLIPQQLVQNAITVIPAELEYFAALIDLPHHHRDPFDRLIVAQAVLLDLPIVTKDPLFAQYSVRCIW